LQTTSSHFDFIRDFLLSIDSNAGAIDIAESFAVRWQKFYQTGRVCLYLASSAGSQILEAVVVETLARAKTVYLDAPADSLLIPRVLDLSQTKLIPLLCNGRVIGAIVFELRYPADAELFQENFKVAASIAGSVLDMTSTSCGRQRFAEEFANLLTRGKGAPQQLARIDSSTGALAEMAAGAAHELNNPLSVISGRAQLLAGAETDPEKKRILTQIQQSAQDLSGIIDDLMTFARPPSPRPTQTSIKQMLDEALQLTSRKTKAEHVNAQIEVADGLKNVFVDSAQVVSAIANVICNSLESYTGEMGPIKITADADRSGGFVELKISDLGCGMDLETMKRAAQPFFSARPAGRKRGMGLAHAQRLIESNNGGLRITSQPGRGTTVIILLPCK
jgi:signal transduction histidine kinase